MLNPYYRSDPLRAFGAAEELPFSDQSIIAVLQSTPPIGVFSQWGAQVDAATWKTMPHQSNYITYPVNATQLHAAAQTGAGPVGFLAVLTTKPIPPAQLEQAFQQTPYKYFSTEGVYRQDDTKHVPTIFFLNWAVMRSDQDPEAGGKSLEASAALLGGQLVFPITVGTGGADRAEPTQDFVKALNTQLAMTPASPSAAPSLPEPIPVPSPAAAEQATPMVPVTMDAPPGAPSAGKLLAALLWVGAGATAAYAGYVLVKGRRQKAAHA